MALISVCVCVCVVCVRMRVLFRCSDLDLDLDLVNPTDNKNRLKNAVHKFLETNKVGWTRDGCDVHGSMFQNTITECLWHIDGNHHMLKERGYAVLEELKQLQLSNNAWPQAKNCRVIEISEHSSAIFHLREHVHESASMESCKEGFATIGS